MSINAVILQIALNLDQLSVPAPFSLICLVFNFMSVVSMTTIVLYFLAIAKSDMSRTAFLMEQLYYMIRISKPRIACKDQIFPTINFFDPVSIKTWLKLRNIANLYGERWLARHQVLLAAGVLKLIGLICYSLIIIFKLVEYKDYRRTSLILMTAFDCMSLTFRLINVMASMSAVNRYTRDQLIQVWSNRSMIQELYSYRNKYFERNYTFEMKSALKKGDLSYRTPMFPEKSKQISKKNIQNPLYRRLAKQASLIWSSSTHLEQGLKQMISFNGRLYEAMRHQEEYMHRTLMGHKVTNRTFGSFSALLISALLIALQGLTKRT